MSNLSRTQVSCFLEFSKNMMIILNQIHRVGRDWAWKQAGASEIESRGDVGTIFNCDSLNSTKKTVKM